MQRLEKKGRIPESFKLSSPHLEPLSPSLVSPPASKESHCSPLHPPYRHLRAAILPGAKWDFPSRRCRHLGGLPALPQGLEPGPGERKASPAGSRAVPLQGGRPGQSQFLCRALDGTDGREFQGSQPAARSVAFHTRGPSGCPEEAAATGTGGSDTPQGIPSAGTALLRPLGIPSRPAKGAATLCPNWRVLQGLGPAAGLPHSITGSLPRAHKCVVDGAALYLAGIA